jgi:hypothetical protein
MGLDPLAVEAAQKRTEAARERARQKRFGVFAGHGTSPSSPVGGEKSEDAPADVQPIPNIDEAGITSERNQHQQFKSWMSYFGIAWVTTRMDKKSPIGNGAPDFFAMKNGKIIWIEFKYGVNKPDADQLKAQAELASCGIDGKNCWSLADAILYTTEKLLKEKI